MGEPDTKIGGGPSAGRPNPDDGVRAVVVVANAGGGLDGLQRFLEHLPGRRPDIYLIHEGVAGSARHAPVLAKSTGLPVERIASRAPLIAGGVWLVPADHAVEVGEDELRLVRVASNGSAGNPLDQTCTSVARARGAGAALVVLAGSLEDGVEGAAEIVSAGGTVIAAVTRGPLGGHLPQAVRRRCTGVIAAPIDSLARALERDFERLTLGVDEDRTHGERPDARELLRLVETQDDGRLARFRADHLLRRADLRRSSLGLVSLGAYTDRLRDDASERHTYVDGLLHPVTTMFDSPGRIETLVEAGLPRLESELSPDVELRAWVPRCGRGLEAYTLAIVLEAWSREHGRQARIFATDEDRLAIDLATEGRLTDEELEAIPERYRSDYVRRANGSWELTPAVRRRLVFSVHDVIADAPFPRLNLVLFRRHLLSLRPAFRKQALERIRFGLVPGGLLVLGDAEEPDGHATDFDRLDGSGPIFLHRPRRGLRPMVTGGVHRPGARPTPASGGGVEGSILRRVRDVLAETLKATGGAAVMLDGDRRMLHVQGSIAGFAGIREGAASDRIEELAEPEFRAALRRLLDDGDEEPAEALVHRADGVLVRVVRIGGVAERGVLFLPCVPQSGVEPVGGQEGDAEILRSELGLMRDELLGAVRELEARNEDLSAYNEELQSSNEELHAVNEELQSVNEEYQRKIAEQMTLTDDLENMLRSSEVGVLFLDMDRCIRRSTPAVARVLPLLEQDYGRPVADLAHHLEGVKLDEMCADVLLDGEPRQQVAHHAALAYLVSVRPYSDHRGARTGVVVEFMDVSALEQARTQLTRSEQQFRQLAENISEIFWIREVESGSFQYISPAFESVWARSVEEVLDDEHSWWRAVHDEDRERACAELREGLERKSYDAEYRVVRGDGSLRWVRDRGFPIQDADGVVRLMAGLAEDVTVSKQQEQELIAAAEALDGLAHQDPLTGSLNRRGLERELRHERNRAVRAGERLSAILCDCDDFKRVNDRLGHAAGDVVLQTIARTLQRTLRPTDHLARVGGDEFIALLSTVRLAEAVQVAERLRRAVAETSVRVGEKQLELTASFGVSVLPDDLGSVEELVAHSQRALASSKRRGKNRVSSVDPSEQREPVGPATDEADRVVRGLLAGRGLTAFAQPLVNMSSGDVVGYEMLIRGPQGAFHNPEALFGLAMERNLLTLTDLSCIQTCLDAARDHIRPDALLHLNLLPSTLLDLTDDRIDELFGWVEDPSRVCVEISEQQFIGEPSYLEAPVQRLRERGVGVGLDDVGFGRSSLETLVLLQPEVVKLDRSQVTGASGSPARVEQLRRLVNVARNGCELIVAEGVETEDDEQLLLELGIETAQGYRLGRPHAVRRANQDTAQQPPERRRGD